MRRAQDRILWGWMGLVVLQLCLPAVWAQNTNALKPGKAGLETPPLPEPLKSPVESFRESLAMNLADRSKALADRPLETRKKILAKIREYESLKPDARELRLQATELRWHLLPLMRMAPSDRAARLAMVPPTIRPLVDLRLNQWDLLPPTVQTDFLQRETALQFYTSARA